MSVAGMLAQLEAMRDQLTIAIKSMREFLSLPPEEPRATAAAKEKANV